MRKFFLVLLLISYEAKGEFGGYTLTRTVIDTKKDNDFEDVFEIRQRVFGEFKEKIGNFSILTSGKIDINYFLGGFERYELLGEIREAYVKWSYKKIDFSMGKQIISWGKIDGSSLDIVNRPDITEGFLTEQRFIKSPSLLLRTLVGLENSSIDIIYEPFWTPPSFSEINSDWALLNWSSFARSGVKKDDESIKPLIEGQYLPFKKLYPKKVDELLKSFSLGINYEGNWNTLGFFGIAYTGFDIFPIPYFETTFIEQFKMQPIKKLEISPLEIIEPLQRGESLISLKPSRFFLLGGGIEYEIYFLLKIEGGISLNSEFLDENLEVKNVSFIPFGLQLERQYNILGINFLPIFQIRGIIPTSRVVILGKGVILTPITLRGEREDTSAIISFSPDIPIEKIKLRSYFISANLIQKIKNFEVEIGGVFLNGERDSLFGFFKENSFIIGRIRYSF